MRQDGMNGLSVKLVDFAILLELDTYSHIYTITVCETCKYFITRVGRRRQWRIAQCKHMTSVTDVKRINCIKLFTPSFCTPGGSLHVFEALNVCT